MSNEVLILKPSITAEKILENFTDWISPEMLETTLHNMYLGFINSDLADNREERQDVALLMDCIKELVNDTEKLKAHKIAIKNVG